LAKTRNRLKEVVVEKNINPFHKVLLICVIISVAMLGLNAETRAEIPAAFSNSIGMRFTLIPAGTFMMGDVNTSGSKPVHQVTITQPFYMGVYEVTNAQYELFVPTHARNSHSPSDNTPVNNIVYSQAIAYCQWLTQQEASTTGYIYRLPHEIEWEWAAHGGHNYAYPNTDPKNLPSGMTIAQALRYEANCYGTGAPDIWTYCAPVGSLAPNGYGLYDMIGNIKEWCINKWYEFPSSPVIHDPYNPGNISTSKSHMIRGNSYWTGDTPALTLYYRIVYGNNDVSPKTGFRLIAMPSTPMPQQLTAKASANPLSVYVNATVAFSGTASGGTPPYRYAWEFGDGYTSGAASPTHAYGTEGRYTATFTVTDAVGDTAGSMVTITVNPLPLPGDTTKATFTIASGNDDGQEKSSSGVILNKGTITVGYGYLNGFRFTNVTIPQGATIVSAKLSTAAEATDRYKVLSLSYWGEAANNAASFGTSGTAKISTRIRTVNQVDYPNLAAWEIRDVYYDSPDLRVIIQEIVDRAGWASGNAMVILQQGDTASGRFVWAKEGSVNLPPKLTVTYLNP
jgi:formylglycine-generating enzyme required for sulfatase activity